LVCELFADPRGGDVCAHAAPGTRSFLSLLLIGFVVGDTCRAATLQNHDEVEGCRLKRVVLIGDHHQLPPVVKNMAFQKYGNFDQSLFARYVMPRTW
jgi:hypothetical protein